MTLVTVVDYLIFIIKHHTLYRGGAYIYTNSHFFLFPYRYKTFGRSVSLQPLDKLKVAEPYLAPAEAQFLKLGSRILIAYRNVLGG